MCLNFCYVTVHVLRCDYDLYARRSVFAETLHRTLIYMIKKSQKTYTFTVLISISPYVGKMFPDKHH